MNNTAKEVCILLSTTDRGQRTSSVRFVRGGDIRTALENSVLFEFWRVSKLRDRSVPYGCMYSSGGRVLEAVNTFEDVYVTAEAVIPMCG